MVIAFLLGIIILWPVVLMELHGMNAFHLLGFYLFSAGLTLYLIFRFGDNIFCLFALIWLLRFGYEATGQTVPYPLLDSFRNSWPLNHLPSVNLILFIFGALVLLLYLKKYVSVSVLDFEHMCSDNTDPWAKEYDKAGPVVLILTERLLRRCKFRSEKGISYLSQAGLIQFGLFSPGAVVLVNAFAFLFALVYLVSVLFILYGNVFDRSEAVVPISLAVYAIHAVMHSTDFLQHRDRLASFWLCSPFSTRSRFFLTVHLTYLLVTLKQFLLISFVFFLGLMVMNWGSLEEIFKLIILAGCFQFGITALSMLMSDLVRSPEAKGWTVPNTILWLSVVFIFLYLWEKLSWPGLLIPGAVVALLHVAAYYKWKETDLDFISPEYYL